jgi:hypothetical protein
MAAFAPVDMADLVVATLLLELDWSPAEFEFESDDDEPESVVELLGLAIGAPYVALIRSAACSATPYAVAIVCAIQTPTQYQNAVSSKPFQRT